MNEQFDNLDLQNTWTRDVELGGFQNSEFELTTDSNNDLFVHDGELYIMPTLTSDTLGRAAIFDGGSYSLSGCTSTNKVASLRCACRLSVGRSMCVLLLPFFSYPPPLLPMLAADHGGPRERPAYPAQGSNFVRASLNYGVLQTLQMHLFGWWSQKQSSYDKALHIYAVEWTPDWMRFYMDSRLQAKINIKIMGHGGKNFFQRGTTPRRSRSS
ncbi:hypothetical protein A0H81_08998 [Grifola frondosa]|uniref:GH16 domain-containing protein n=1 Tax=Grifola frondosa TaxID=5627 RepID=A0A1C7M3D2_GRIFR|nr:hypothetical protein A0H81_08998 [Grifola frondosa]